MAPALGGGPVTTTDIVPAATTGMMPSPTSTGSPSGGNNVSFRVHWHYLPLTTCQGLYLYTFMITLLVLFGVSVGVIARSCVLRRRFRRQMAAAVDAGVVLPPRLAKNHVPLGEKPVLYEVWMDHPHSREQGWPGVAVSRWARALTYRR